MNQLIAMFGGTVNQETFDPDVSVAEATCFRHQFLHHVPMDSKQVLHRIWIVRLRYTVFTTPLLT